MDAMIVPGSGLAAARRFMPKPPSLLVPVDEGQEASRGRGARQDFRRGRRLRRWHPSKYSFSYQAGFDWREPGCSMCLGMNPDRLKPQEPCSMAAVCLFLVLSAGARSAVQQLQTEISRADRQENWSPKSELHKHMRVRDHRVALT